jgi:hypothetical protein
LRVRASGEVNVISLLFPGGDAMRVASRSKLLATVFMISFMLPCVLYGGQPSAQVHKDILPGVTYESFAGQHFRFETTVPIRVSFKSKSPTHIILKFKMLHSSEYNSEKTGKVRGQRLYSEGDYIIIAWEDWASDIYNGAPPSGIWEGILDTESGFTEK